MVDVVVSKGGVAERWARHLQQKWAPRVKVGGGMSGRQRANAAASIAQRRWPQWPQPSTTSATNPNFVVLTHPAILIIQANVRGWLDRRV